MPRALLWWFGAIRLHDIRGHEQAFAVDDNLHTCGLVNREAPIGAGCLVPALGIGERPGQQFADGGRDGPSETVDIKKVVRRYNPGPRLVPARHEGIGAAGGGVQRA